MREKMSKRFWHGQRTTGRAPSATPNEEDYESPTLGLKN